MYLGRHTSHHIHDTVTLTALRPISSTPRAGAAARTHTGHRHRPGEATPVNRSTLRGRCASAGSPITVGSPPRSIDLNPYSRSGQVRSGFTPVTTRPQSLRGTYAPKHTGPLGPTSINQASSYKHNHTRDTATSGNKGVSENNL